MFNKIFIKNIQSYKKNLINSQWRSKGGGVGARALRPRPGGASAHFCSHLKSHF